MRKFRCTETVAFTERDGFTTTITESFTKGEVYYGYYNESYSPTEERCIVFDSDNFDDEHTLTGFYVDMFEEVIEPKKYLCTKTLRMLSGEVSFIQGCYYESVGNAKDPLIDEFGDRHFLAGWEEYFVEDDRK